MLDEMTIGFILAVSVGRTRFLCPTFERIGIKRCPTYALHAHAVNLTTRDPR